ncbi:DUF4055 domain-containing protein [Paracoccus yeei]|uniref:DUF4055 domain-containing protein n=1 Tax=Paracoccus yeei TaxID=147645 RepID=UPI0017485721|nr:DUF4055 domain-containing protein [Paracoccus yeei]
MAVDTPGAFHVANIAKWRRCRDFMAGADAVKAAGAEYAPRPSGLDDGEFKGYLMRGTFFNATQRTVDSLIGLVMAKPPAVDMPASLEEMTWDFDGAGSTAEDYARDAVADVLTVGGGCAVVDRPTRPAGIVTRDQERQAGLRPYATWYPIESVLDWRYGTVNGKRELVFLRLNETWTEIIDEWDEEIHQQIRVFDLLDDQARCRVFRKAASGMWEVYQETMLIKDNGQPWQYVPAVMFGPVKNEPEKSPILDLVEINRGHWQNSVDLEHGLHFTGLPTAYVAGHTFEDGEEVRLGSKTLFAFDDPNAKLAFASFGSEGLAGLEKAMERKEQQMAALGARMLLPEGAAAESGEALAIRRGGENSALGKLADSVSRSMELLIETMAEWEGNPEAVSYRLNTDYLPNAITAQELTAAISAVDRGLMSQQEFFDMLKAGGLVRDDKTYEEHAEETLGMGDAPLDGKEPE